MAERPHPTEMAFRLLLGLRTQLQLPKNDPAVRFLSFCAQHHMLSNAQLFQDLFALFMLGGKRQGFFVEFGACNGIDGSNSLSLERQFGWRGILAEPARRWHAALGADRNAAIDRRCVWSKTGETLAFHEAAAAGLSTIESFAERDYASEMRRNGKQYPVQTVSLNDLLADHAAPRRIDYMSVDTEGSEFDILNAFDFTRYEISLLTVEHNNVEPDRGNIHALLSRHGFTRVFEPFSMVDDWYVHRSVFDAAGGAMPADAGAAFKF